MKLSDLKKMNTDVITPNVASKVLGCDPHWIRVAAHQDKSLLGFPVVLIGNRVKIPRKAFIRFMEGEKEYETS